MTWENNNSKQDNSNENISQRLVRNDAIQEGKNKIQVTKSVEMILQIQDSAISHFYFSQPGKTQNSAKYHPGQIFHQQNEKNSLFLLVVEQQSLIKLFQIQESIVAPLCELKVYYLNNEEVIAIDWHQKYELSILIRNNEGQFKVDNYEIIDKQLVMILHQDIELKPKNILDFKIYKVEQNEYIVAYIDYQDKICLEIIQCGNRIKIDTSDCSFSPQDKIKLIRVLQDEVLYLEYTNDKNIIIYQIPDLKSTNKNLNQNQQLKLVKVYDLSENIQLRKSENFDSYFNADLQQRLLVMIQTQILLKSDEIKDQPDKIYLQEIEFREEQQYKQQSALKRKYPHKKSRETTPDRQSYPHRLLNDDSDSIQEHHFHFQILRNGTRIYTDKQYQMIIKNNPNCITVEVEFQDKSIQPQNTSLNIIQQNNSKVNQIKLTFDVSTKHKDAKQQFLLMQNFKDQILNKIISEVQARNLNSPIINLVLLQKQNPFFNTFQCSLIQQISLMKSSEKIDLIICQSNEKDKSQLTSLIRYDNLLNDSSQPFIFAIYKIFSLLKSLLCILDDKLQQCQQKLNNSLPLSSNYEDQNRIYKYFSDFFKQIITINKNKSDRQIMMNMLRDIFEKEQSFLSMNKQATELKKTIKLVKLFIYKPQNLDYLMNEFRIKPSASTFIQKQVLKPFSKWEKYQVSVTNDIHSQALDSYNYTEQSQQQLAEFIAEKFQQKNQQKALKELKNSTISHEIKNKYLIGQQKQFKDLFSKVESQNCQIQQQVTIPQPQSSLQTVNQLVLEMITQKKEQIRKNVEISKQNIQDIMKLKQQLAAKQIDKKIQNKKSQDINQGIQKGFGVQGQFINHDQAKRKQNLRYLFNKSAYKRTLEVEIAMKEVEIIEITRQQESMKYKDK